MSTGRGADKEDAVYVYNGTLFSHKRDEVMPFTATWMDLELIVLRSQTEKDKYHMMSLVCGILKN